MMRFERSVWVAAPVTRLFAFHERPDALEKLNPPWQPMELVEHRGGIEKGARVTFRLYFGPFWKTWVALHTAYEKNRLFEDTQIEGPFHSWRHQHGFRAEGSGSRLTDSVRFSLPGGRLAEALLGPAILKQLEKMFEYRHAVTKRECE